ncbi:MFS transporter [Metallosphaera tengchongensis]|uniref:MFS transporter n=1 Tax=Metallosphaera tengchongensis TaxID=1532350 RepID=A0A6N0NWP2_9CREN|nr:MFS transporter [Metallosphaera tengchongensis]QKR00647.1 MFS transporter [Metallosphaera tengchongensis]
MKISFHVFTVMVFLTGLFLGVLRLAYPVIEINSYSYVLYSLIVFGVVKSIMNYVSGHLSDFIGRKKVLLLGWLAALPISVFGLFRSSEVLILLTAFLGVNQALTWTTTVTSQIDLTGKKRAGLAAGFNETFGYLGVALGNFIAGILIESEISPYLFLLFTSLLALSIGSSVRETKPSQGVTSRLSLTSPLLIGMAGLLEKFVDAFFWVLVPLYLYLEKQSPLEIATIVTIYSMSWASLQTPMGHISDVRGRTGIILIGFTLMSIGVASFPLNYYLSALISGIGMAMVYPTLIALVNDDADIAVRGRALGVYRLLRDGGYAIAGLFFFFTYHTPSWSIVVVVMCQILAMITISWRSRIRISQKIDLLKSKLFSKGNGNYRGWS